MDERINKIIQGFDEIYNKIKDLKLYNDIFNIFTEKLKKEFRRVELYMSDENYNNCLAQINTIDLTEIENIIKKYIDDFKKIENLNDISQQYSTFIINELTNYNWNSMTYIAGYIMTQINSFEKSLKIFNSII